MQTSQLTSVDRFNFTTNAGACVRVAASETDVAYGSQASGEDGGMVEIATSDLLVPAQSEVLDLGFDEAGALDFVSDSDGSQVMSRDAEGRITSIFDGYETQTMGYVSDQRDPAMLQEGGDEEARGQLVAPNGWLIAENRDPAGLSRYYLSDHRGTPTSEYGRSGSQLGSRDLDAYGQPLGLQTSGTMSTTVGFTGERQDPETGFTDHDARSYDPELRTWVSMDQFQSPSQDLQLALDPSNANRAQYAGANPMTCTDPTGHLLSSDGSRRGLSGVQIGGGGRVYSYNHRYGTTYQGRGQSAVFAAQAQARRQAATEARWRQSAEYKRKQRVLAQRAANKARADRIKRLLAAALAGKPSTRPGANRASSGVPTPFGVPSKEHPPGCMSSGRANCSLVISNRGVAEAVANRPGYTPPQGPLSRWMSNAAEAVSQACSSGPVFGCGIALPLQGASAVSDIDRYVQGNNQRLMFENAASSGSCIRYEYHGSRTFTPSHGDIVRPHHDNFDSVC